MKVAAVTITYNRLELTKRTIESFQSKTSVDYHLFIDNGSSDGTKEYVTQFNHVLLDKNYGIAFAFREAVKMLKGYDFILKLDNDVETVTDDIISKMILFFQKCGHNYVISPVDLNLDKAYSPAVFGKQIINGYKCTFTTHTGGAFQLIPYSICDRLCREYRHLRCGDYMIGRYYRRHAYRPAYLDDLQMRHIGLNLSTPQKEYIL